MAITINPRTVWGANPPSQRVLMARSNGNYIHYNGPAVPTGVFQAALNAVLGFLRSIQQFHMGPSRKWSDFAYSFAVDTEGRVFEGRGWGVAGAHTNGQNSTSHGIYLILGEGQAPTAKQVAAVRELIAEHDCRYGRGFIRGHQQAPGAATACPGGPAMQFLRDGAFDPYRTHPAAPTPPVKTPPPAPAQMPVDWAAVRRWVAGVAWSNLGLTKGLIRRGDRGGHVKAVQEAVNVITGRGLKVDGDFGPATEAAVTDYQKWFRAHGAKLTVDGVVGDQTRNHMRGILAKIRDGKA